MLHDFFHRSINPKPQFHCLRVPLQPLTLGHLFLLRELNSEVFSEDGFGFESFQQAVFVCAHNTAEEARQALNSNRAWAWLIGTYWGWRCRKLLPVMRREMERFCDYLASERELPPMQKAEEGEGMELHSPQEWVLLDFLLSTYRLSRREALDLPLRSVNALWVVHMELAGRLRLATAGGSTGSLIHQLWEIQRQKTRTEAG